LITATVIMIGTKTSRPANSHVRRAAITLAPYSGEAEDAAGAGVAVAGAAAGASPVDTGVAAGDAAVAAVALPPSRKSVTYQPLPFNWKPAAVTCFENVACKHDGQSVKSGSDIFCSTSLAKPQAEHL